MKRGRAKRRINDAHRLLMGNENLHKMLAKYGIFVLKATWSVDWRPGFLLELSLISVSVTNSFLTAMSKTSDPRDPALEKKVSFPRSWGRENLGMCTIQHAGSTL